MEQTFTFDLPGRFDSWFEGTHLIQTGKVEECASDPHDQAVAQAVLDAYNAARRIKRGKEGYTLRLRITGPLALDVIAYLAEYGDYCIHANSDNAFGRDREPSAYSEYKAGERVRDRANEILVAAGWEPVR